MLGGFCLDTVRSGCVHGEAQFGPPLSPTLQTAMTWKLAQYALSRYACAALASALFCSALVGCGSSQPTAQSTPNQSANQVALDDAPSPTDIVSQFLDQVRRGGDNSAAGMLLTQQAQSELNRIGRSVQPIGSPDASFNVTRGEANPNDPNTMLVHSIWSEPNETEGGEQSNYQVVWALRKEPVGWRISGLAMEFEPGVDPEIINFEDGNSMLQILGGMDTPADSAAAQAEAPGASTTR